MRSYINSDLAIESKGRFLSKKNKGGEYSEEEKDWGTVCRLNISSKALEKKYGREKGHYVTVFCESIALMDEGSIESLSKSLSMEIEAMISASVQEKKGERLSVFVVGLGNAEITADSIGPLTVRELTVTRHLRSFYEKILGEDWFASVCALTPGVLAQTGIESYITVRELTKSISPDAVIVIDALCARSCERLGSTFQISDTGISPGAGIGNIQKGINKGVLGVPVIAIGVPTVVDSATLVCDAIERAGVDIDSEKLLGVLDNERRFFVSPKECDLIVKAASKILANSIDMALGTQS